MANEYDVIIIGSGPNGLTAACYLSKAGQKVLLLTQTVRRKALLPGKMSCMRVEAWHCTIVHFVHSGIPWRMVQSRPETDLTKREHGFENDTWSSIY